MTNRLIELSGEARELYLLYVAASQGAEGFERFFLFQRDAIYDLEYEVSNSADASGFYAALADLYTRWLDDLTADGRAALRDHHDEMPSADQNWMLFDLDAYWR